MGFWAAIGLLTGAVMGLGGAGGAIVAVPLFKILLGASLHEATAYALFAVLISAVLNAYAQRRHCDRRLALGIGVCSIAGSLPASWVKHDVPAAALTALFVLTCLFSFWNLWRPARAAPRVEGASPPGRLPLGQVALGGLGVGALATFTGLGGGVVMVPWLAGRVGMPFPRAVATSLAAVALIATFSILAQLRGPVAGLAPAAVALLAVGSLVSIFVTRAIMAALPPAVADRARKGVLSLVIAFSIVSVLA